MNWLFREFCAKLISGEKFVFKHTYEAAEGFRLGYLYSMVSFFHDIVGFLNKEKIPYMLSGSVAMSIYIVPRATKDMDFVVELRPEDVKRLATHFGKGYYCDLDAMLESLRRKQMFNIIDHSTGFKADFFPLVQTPFEQKKFSRRTTADFVGVPVHIISLEDLLLSKLIWIQQLQSVQQMVDIQNLSLLETLDRDYVRQWIKELNLATFDISL